MARKLLVQAGSATLELVVGPATVDLINFRALDKRKGHGTACLQKAIEWADQNGRTIRLTADPPPRAGLMTSAQLVSFYERFGFVVDESWAGSKPVRMIRVVR